LGAWMFVCCECCVLSGRGICDELITRPEESYRLWCVVVCDLETSRMRRPWPALGRSATGGKNTVLYMYMFRAISCSSSGGQIVLIQHLVIIQFDLLRMSKILLDTCTCRGFNKCIKNLCIKLVIG